MPPALLRFSLFPPYSSAEGRGTAIPTPNTAKNGRVLTVAVDQLEIDGLRSRNLELQRQLNESQTQEKELRTQLEKMKIRLCTVEEAEERLSSQLGDFEAESVQEAHHYNLQLADLKQRLSHTENLLSAARAELERHRS